PNAGQRLRLIIAIEGNLHARTVHQAVELADADGTPALRYGHLLVTDATGRRLSAGLGLTAGTGRSQTLWLEVDDRRAAWPITVDPTFTQQAFLTASNVGPGDNFGSAIAIS